MKKLIKKWLITNLSVLTKFEENMNIQKKINALILQMAKSIFDKNL